MRLTSLARGLAKAEAACVLALASASGLPGQALAQRASDNATTQSIDGFGRQIGTERSGIYSNDNVRGFDPQDAGNIRIDGFYADLVAPFPPRIHDGTTVRVGFAAQAFPFPVPTGLIDYQLRKPGVRMNGSFELEQGVYGSDGLRAEISGPLGDGALGMAAGASIRNIERQDGSDNLLITWGLSLQTQSNSATSFKVFMTGLRNRDEEARVSFLPAGDFLPARPVRRAFIGQPWAQRDNDGVTIGAIGRVPVSEGLRMEGGAFYSRQRPRGFFGDIFSGVTADGSAASRAVIYDPDRYERSISGEGRLVLERTTGSFQHQIMANLRIREKLRHFGGSRAITLGRSTVTAADFRQRPVVANVVTGRDQSRTFSPGIAYSLFHRSGLNLNFGAQRTSYSKRLTFPAPSMLVIDADTRPTLWYGTAFVPVVPGLTVYGGVTRGIEEVAAAPDRAVNRSEAPPSLITSQRELGLRCAVSDGFAVSIGAFSISKPYFNLDPELRYRDLGSLRNRGLELSMTGKVMPGLTLVAGALLLDPEVQGEAVALGLIGRRPVGQTRLRSALNLDWRMNAGKSPTSIDLAIETFSERPANIANTLLAPGYSQIALGARHRFSIGKADLVFRPRIENLLNSFGWVVAGSGAFTYSGGRTLSLQLLADL